MARTIYPPADTRTQWWGGNSVMAMTRPKLVWHTTEAGKWWPSYRDGADAPTLTYHPWQHKWRQHMPLNESARALRDPSRTAVRENRDDVIQVEICCYCDPGMYRRHGYAVTDLDERALDDLGDFARFLHVQWGLRLVNAPGLGVAYPDSLSGYRMTGPEFDAYEGILGHCNVSGNSHGDPGALDVERILVRAKGQEGDDMTLDDQVNDEHTVRQVLNRMDRYIGNSFERETAANDKFDRVLAVLDALPEKVAMEIPEQPGIDMQQLRVVVRAAVERGVRAALTETASKS